MAEHTVSIDSFLAEWAAAEQSGDTDTLEGLLADDFVGIGPLGFSLPKSEWLARYRQGLHYDAFGLEETQVRTYGDVAVVTARNNQRGTYYGNPVPEAARSTCVLVLQEGRWQLAAIHLSFIAGTAGTPPIPGAPGPAATGTDQA